MDDFRLAVSFPHHPKIQKLQRKLGDSGPLGFIYLMAHAAQLKPDGKLTGMDTDDIAIAAQWKGDAAVFVDTLVEMRLLDKKMATYSIHDWHDHNPFVATSPERSAAAKKAAEIRWKDRIPKGSKSALPNSPSGNADLCDGQCTPHKSALPDDADGNAPSPSPLPSPNPSPNPTSASSASALPEWADDEDEFLRKFLQTQNLVPIGPLWNKAWWDALSEAVDGIDLAKLRCAFGKIRALCVEKPGWEPQDAESWQRVVRHFLIDEEKASVNGTAKR